MQATKHEDFCWQRQPAGQALFDELLREATAASPALAQFAQQLLRETGTRLIDICDHVGLPANDPRIAQLAQIGFRSENHARETVWEHPGGLFPRIRQACGGQRSVAVLVESVADFLCAHGRDDRTPISGAPGAAVRLAVVDSQSLVAFQVIERHGERGFEPTDVQPDGLAHVAHHAASLRRRRRSYATPEQGFQHACELIAEANAHIGVARTCDLFFAAEREYWQRRNRAARAQKARQDRLGIGWSNHDHHTYRSSRECFVLLAQALELMGFQCRERFYAGQEAGWGAQVFEQPACGIVVFADVDLSPEEVSGDFAHQALPPGEAMGTVGLWCQLHGEAFLEAGLHHLECQFSFDAATAALADDGIARMAPFTDFEHLRQAFTTGENWPVAEARIERALERGWISADQAKIFERDGAIGSHLEILERNDGYKGFNQAGISDIIRQTDPRFR
ncbi:MAG: hypothetical protein KDA42_01070 [Planctomycetales bacterium]|nr:hypothetical protein [Planctomycetales bacterium]